MPDLNAPMASYPVTKNKTPTARQRGRGKANCNLWIGEDYHDYEETEKSKDR